MNKMDIRSAANEERRNIIETILFFTVTYGVCWSVGVLNYSLKFMSGNMMASFMMILPATGVSIAKLYRNVKNDENRKVHFVYVGYFISFIFLIFLKFENIINEDILELFNIILLIPASILILLFSWIDGGKLDPTKNWKKAKWGLIIFILAYIVGLIIACIDMQAVDFNSIMHIPISYALFLVQAALFFGEEYGWRGFLQEKMQRRFGKRIGVVFLGIIWELWHMPIWFSVYRVDGFGLALRFLVVGSISIVIGYAYMKSNNVWVCAFMHYTNNLFATVFLGSYNINANHITGGVIAELLVLFIVFSLFLCTKEYRKNLQ